MSPYNALRRASAMGDKDFNRTPRMRKEANN